ncbi:MAG: aminotransferase class I/II-fold pyridoxal phosphate-dependent enzyme [Desulfobacterales bacterium]|jgi:aspartate/methionine/tyrosine aminotransferase|nr:aminotransferase class I/II-fold pyridoxal phosphate-dependent enzyme [Desulfobacterales bacterium]
MNPIAKELNQTLQAGTPQLYDMLSDIGKNLFFPKGILSQSAEAKEKAYRLNATIGIATEEGKTMHFPSVMNALRDIAPEKALTYAPSFGLMTLRKAWQDSLKRKNPSLADTEIGLPIVTCGITHAISVFADVWVDPGDVVILPDMMWGNYSMILSVRKGARIAQYPLFSNAGGFNLAAFEAAVNQEAKTNKKIIVLLNFPQNPTGYTATQTEGAAIVQILAKIARAGTQVIAVSDDAYFGLFYEKDTLKESLFAQLCRQDSRLLAVKLDGATKELFVWGLRVGFITYGIKMDGNSAAVYDALEKKTAGAVRGSISNASHLSQTIVLQSLEDKNHAKELEEKFAILCARAKRVKEVLRDEKYRDAFEAYPFNSGYFMCIRVKNVDAEVLRVHLLNQYGVGLISFGPDNLRIAFSCLEEKDIPLLFDTILRGISDLKA